MADLRSTHQRHRSNGQHDECEDGMFRGVSGHTGGQGEDNNDADSSDDESIMSRENENNTSNIPPNSGSDNHNRRTTSGGRNSRELDSSFGNRRVTGGTAAARLHDDSGVSPPSREALLAAWQLMQQQRQGVDQERFQHGDEIHDDGNNGNNHTLCAAGRRALSYRVAKQLQKKHVKSRIQSLVKSHIFRKCKFITSAEYYDKVMAVVIDAEKPTDPTKFVRIYKTCVLGSLNSKRSSCEQATSDACMLLLKAKNHPDEVTPEPYSIEMLCKLRQSQTPEEKEAFLWFTGKLLECVVGKIAWGSKKKYRSRISEAKYDNTNESIVTVSDEAFALLLYENYIGKYITRYHNPLPQGEKERRLWESTLGAVSDVLNMEAGARKGDSIQ
ncbi:hypothetical protein MHU86_14712 [Fragilaria crotonensis]|nr:hypothetical protein MHU86_14712 [Fragilaria crotonensis]